MKKNMVVAAIAAALATPLVANAEAIMYGQLRVATQTHSRSDINGAWGMEDQQSRLGVKGSEDLDSGLKAIYQLEFGVNVGGGFDPTGASKAASGKDANFWSQRDSFVGLAGPFGTILAGRHDTPMKMSTASLDFFRDTAADNDTQSSFVPSAAGGMDSTGVGLFDSRRVDGAIAYVSPNFAGFSVVGAAVQSNTHSFQDSEAFAGAYSVAGMYSNGPIFASAAYETIDLSNFADAFSGAHIPVYNKWRVGAGLLNFNNISASAIYEQRNDEFVAGGVRDSSSWQLQAAYNLPGMRLKGMYGHFDGEGGSTAAGSLTGMPSFDTWALGVEYNLSKRTDIQMLYRTKTYDVNGPRSDKHHDPDITDDVFALQLDHTF